MKRLTKSKSQADVGRPFHLKILFPIPSPTSRQVLSNGSIFSPLVGQILSNLNSYWLKLMRNMVSCHDSLLEFHRIFTTNQLGQSHIQLTISQGVHWKGFRRTAVYVDFTFLRLIVTKQRKYNNLLYCSGDRIASVCFKQEGENRGARIISIYILKKGILWLTSQNQQW